MPAAKARKSRLRPGLPPKATPIVQWIEDALRHAGMSQSRLSRELKGSHDADVDRTIVNKILKQERKVTAEELYAIEKITAFPIPPGLAPRSSHEITEVRLFDRVSAGKLRTPVSQLPVEDLPLLTFADLGKGEWFALRVDEEGDSMDRISPPNSIIIVNQADKELVSGKCYVFAIDGDTTYKMWQDDDPPYLAPCSTNSRHKPILITSKKKRDFAVLGRVKRTILDL